MRSPSVSSSSFSLAGHNFATSGRPTVAAAPAVRAITTTVVQAMIAGTALGSAVVLFVLVPLLTPARIAPVERLRSSLPLLTSTVLVFAAASSWRNARRSEAQGRTREASSFREQAQWRARLAARRRANERGDA